jgi:hypothetical protein
VVTGTPPFTAFRLLRVCSLPNGRAGRGAVRSVWIDENGVGQVAAQTTPKCSINDAMVVATATPNSDPIQKGSEASRSTRTLINALRTDFGKRMLMVHERHACSRIALNSGVTSVGR